MADIFISYAREDISKASAIAVQLEARGWSVFWDRHIPPGQDFNDYLQQQVDSARCVLVLWSRASVASSYVRDEATEGRVHHRLVPALLEQVQPPLGFRQLHLADLTGWTDGRDEGEFNRLVDSIRTLAPLVSTNRTSTPEPPEEAVPSPVKDAADGRLNSTVQPKNRRWLIVTSLAVLLAVGGWLGRSLWSNPAEESAPLPTISVSDPDQAKQVLGTGSASGPDGASVWFSPRAKQVINVDLCVKFVNRTFEGRTYRDVFWGRCQLTVDYRQQPPPTCDLLGRYDYTGEPFVNPRETLTLLDKPSECQKK